MLPRRFYFDNALDDLFEDETTILSIYNIAKEYPEDTEKDIYQKLNIKS